MSKRIGLRHIAQLFKKLMAGAGEYTGITALGGNVNMAQWGGATTPKGVVVGCAQWGGVSVDHQIEDYAQWGGVTTVLGTVS